MPTSPVRASALTGGRVNKTNIVRLSEAERNELLAFAGSGKIQVEGNQLEFMRLTKTAILLVDGLRALD